MLPFFSATTGPFVLKFGMVVENTVGHQAKNFGANRINTFRVILNLVAKKVNFNQLDNLVKVKNTAICCKIW